jgi:hypothetical protein
LPSAATTSGCSPRLRIATHQTKRLETDTWNFDEPELLAELGSALRVEALPFLSRVERPEDAARVAALQQKPQDFYVQQAVAYGFALGGDVERATIALDRLTLLLGEETEPYRWKQDLAQTVESLKNEVRDDLEAGQRRLEAWRRETAKHLGVGQ